MIARRIYAAVLIGILLRFVVNLTPVAWLVWFAPMPLLVLAYRSTARQTDWLTALAAMIGLSANFHYYRLVMPLRAVLLVLCLQALLWVLIVGATRRIVVRYQAWWTVFAYPVFWVAADTLEAHLLPDTNWGSLAYSQADLLPVLQFSSLFGVGGVLFLLALLPSALALAAAYGSKIPKLWRAYAVTAVLLLFALEYGELRLHQPVSGTPVVFGMASIDDGIGLEATPAYIATIWRSYDQHIADLAAQGAEVIVLPEKIGSITPATASEWQQHLSTLAAQHHLWIAAGVGIVDAGKKTNIEWLFAPDGRLDDTYQKHHMAPPERDNIPGTGFDVRSIGDRQYGLAICKDMHFASLGRAYGERRVSAMLVPAWDFDLDRWLASRMTLTRGVENGYTVVCSSREGMLSVSDPFGRVLAERESRPLPGSALLVRAEIAPPLPTLYTRVGDLPGWLCVAAAAFLLGIGRGRRGEEATAEGLRHSPQCLAEPRRR
jgi:apolipoprotein N-acyltransferase